MSAIPKTNVLLLYSALVYDQMNINNNILVSKDGNLSAEYNELTQEYVICVLNQKSVFKYKDAHLAAKLLHNLLNNSLPPVKQKSLDMKV